MSLLLNEDFTLYNLRLVYLNTVHDGVGERLINLPTAVLNEPAFRSAGFIPDAAAIKRCYSPPIPTTGAADYFTRPVRTRGNALQLADSPEETQGGLISGHRGSEDTLGPGVLSEKEKRRRRQRERIEEDDSSELSDDSEEEDTAAQSVRFAKMPVRTKSEGVIMQPPPPPREQIGLGVDGPEVKVISPSFRPRTSSLGAGTGRQTGRPRRDTTTSSEMSSDNDMLEAGSTFRRKIPSRPQKPVMLADKIAEEEPQNSELEDEEDEDEEEDDVEVAEASDLSDEFEGDDVAQSLPDLLGVAAGTTSSPPQVALHVPPAITPTHTSPKKSRDPLPKLPRLPSNRPMSTVPPASLLTMALKGASGGGADDQPFQKYAELSGKGEASPLWIRIYYPFADTSSKPLEIPVRRTKAGDEATPTVSDLIGLALYRYEEESYKPALKLADNRILRWELRMVDDGEVEMDFPALDRAKAVTDFTSNNNRPPQRRARDKPWDEFGLVRAEDIDSDEESPAPASTATSTALPTPIPEAVPSNPAAPAPAPPTLIPNRNPITGPSFALTKTATRSNTGPALDAPQLPTTTSTPRTGAAKTLTLHFVDPQSFQTTLLPVPTTSDTYIAEVFDLACTRLRLDKALYVLKVRGTQTVAPSDRTVEALANNLHLDLVRRRFGAVGDFGLGLSGSPGSSSPNAPLELVPNTPPTAKEAKRRKGFGVLNPLTQAPSQTNVTQVASSTALAQLPGAAPMPGRRYNVQRKLPLSFSGSHPRTLIITPEYLQILPSSNPADEPVGAAGGKVTNVHMSSIVGVKVSRKHPKMVRVLVWRERETKRYDFECANREEAGRVVEDVRVGVGGYGAGGGNER